MLTLSTRSVSDSLDLNAAIARLAASPLVDGIAAFGSRAAHQTDVVSDYDLLILVRDLPARIFQMVTTIGGRVADIVPVEIGVADDLLAAAAPPPPRSFEGLFAQKMQTAHILYDASNRLKRIHAQVASTTWAAPTTNEASEADLYSIWFWQSFGLLHLNRMAQSTNPIHLSAVDMMLTSCLPTTWRSYFDLRGIAWQGEKAAVRYWTQHDAGYLEKVNACFAAPDRPARLAAYQSLVEITLQPIGKIFTEGDTAVLLTDSNDLNQNVRKSLDYWNSLFSSTA